MSKAIGIKQGSGELFLKERAIPVAKGRNVLVEIHASSMNPHDWKFYQQFSKLYQRATFLPDMLLGHDLSGKVIAIGPGVRQFKVGDEVYAMSAKTGAFGEHVSIDERMVARKPFKLSHQQAASVPMAALTAWQAFILTKLKKGDELLVIGGSGGVGIFAIQFAKVMGARITAVCSTNNVELVKFLGADQVVDYKKEDYHQLETQFDVIFDVVGGESRKSCASILKPGARFLSTATSVGNIAEIAVSRVNRLFNRDAIAASTLLAMPLGKHLQKIARLIEEDKVKVLVDKVYPLEQIEEAIAYSKQGRTKGKIVIHVKDEAKQEASDEQTA